MVIVMEDSRKKSENVKNNERKELASVGNFKKNEMIFIDNEYAIINIMYC